MGTWNFNIKSDDFVLDVIGQFNDHLRQNNSISQTTELLIKNYKEEINDENDGPLFWIAIGEIQWKYGELDKSVLDKIKNDFVNERGLEIWAEQSETLLQKRKNVIEKFIQKLETKNPKPKKIPKLIIRKPIYQTGDCLSVLTKNNLYTASLVLASNHDNPELGFNTIASLNYLSSEKPTLDVFEKRNWLKLTHHNHTGRFDIGNFSYIHWRKEKHRFEVIGNISILKCDPIQTGLFDSYVNLGNQIILQREWEKTI